MKTINILLLLKVILAIILLQTLFFKFTASAESVYIFQQLDAEPFGRISSGIIELIASFLLFFRRTKFYAAIVILGTMTVAVLSHVFVLGIEIMNDNGTLFFLACFCLAVSGYIAFRYKNDFINDSNPFKSTQK